MKKISLIILLLLAVLAESYAMEYYVDSIAGSDANSGTSILAPWKTLTPVKNAVFQPGDFVNFARGCSWSAAAFEFLWIIDNSGAAGNPITFRAYGTGNKPTFKNGGNRFNSAISIAASYIVIEDFLIQNTGSNGFYLATGSSYNIIRNCEVTTTGVAFYVNDNSSYNLFTNNYIHDLIMVVDDTGPNCTLPRTDPLWNRNPCDNDFGCVSFWLRAPYNEISYNTSVNNVGHSFDYGADGGFIEMYINCTGTYAHHNFVDRGVGVVEASSGSGTTTTDVTLAYNVFIEHKGLFAIKPSFPVSNFKIENNTFITAEGTLSNNMLGEVTGTTVRNNIFVLSGNGERVGTSNVFTHTNNIYQLLNGALLGSVILGEGESIADPLFLDYAGKDYRLQPTSPAVNAGADLGYTADFLNMPVPFGPAPDIGAYESSALVPEINIRQAATGINDNTGSYSFDLVDYATPKTVTFTIENPGGATLNLSGSPRVSVTGTGFSLAADAPATIAAGSSATFDVTLTTASFINYTGTVSITSDDANETPYNFSISGKGYDATKALQTITFNAIPTQTLGAADFDPGASASSALPVTYVSSNTAVAIIVNEKIQLVAEGITTITASQAGDAAYNPAESVAQSLTVIGTNFTAGNIVVSRLGDGTTALGATTTTVRLLEFTPSTANQTEPVKTLTIASTNPGNRLTIVGNTAYESQLSRSSDGQYICMIGYDQAPGSTSVVATNGNKVIGRVSIDGSVDYSTSFPTTASGSAKIAVSDNGSRFWTSINNIGYVTFGQTITAVSVNSASQRSLGVFNNQLYGLQGFSSLFYTNVPLPSGASALTTAVPVPGGQSYEGFAFLDLDPGVSWNNTGFDLVYAANVFAGLEKFYYDGSTWIRANSNANTPANQYSPAGTGFSALAATVNGLGQPVIYATTGNGSLINNRLYAITDGSGRTGTMVGGASANTTAIILATAGANYAFRGVALTPFQTVLPVSLVSFKGSLIDNKAALRWLTASENNAKEYIVERSHSGNDYLPIGKVAALNRATTSSYAFDDANLKKGMNFYRLKMVDEDGSYQYSNVVPIKYGGDLVAGMSVFPNPVIGQLTATHEKAQYGATLKITAPDGRMIGIYPVSNNSVQTTINTSQLRPGLYLLTYVNDGKSLTKTFVK